MDLLVGEKGRMILVSKEVFEGIAVMNNIYILVMNRSASSLISILHIANRKTGTNMTRGMAATSNDY